jgi:NAD(P)-dependent dehydrogenase (short-subunit alcohol dehydrogenase family)
MRLQRQRAIITGTATGIGREIACCFAKEGAEIIAVDWDATGNETTCEMVKAAGGYCRTFRADVSLEKDVVEVFSAAGPINILINNAAFVEGDGRLTELNAENWDKVLGVCLRSVFCARGRL